MYECGFFGIKTETGAGGGIGYKAARFNLAANLNHSSIRELIIDSIL